ncbi:lysophospholipid acyltransferase family protein [Rhodococcus sp. HNM0569]|uniref:lysophospholipid acyltransferase family protein n=1 Tax=Rhodococcus sp. HNM0569 TaxID=2716340 RepID=UPI00146F52E9|nr:lysophospholipid acyltransferase family protein [Rhodococcus sp. HNM0569]NLU82896.1 1-acyl-sn-glycerol-3-phosphate acyltransferase [Rhodococcus sp. HNM0569]
MFYWLVKFVFVGPFIKLYNRPKVEGLEHVPTDGPVLLAGNHLSIADWLFTPLAIPRRVTYLAKSDYFTTPGLRGMLQKFFYTQTGQVPLDRRGADAAESALLTARGLLEDGKIVGLFPEGTRSPDGRLYKGKTGIARIALETGVPVVPVGVVGTDEVSPPGPFRWRRRRVRVTFGAPLDFSRYEGMVNNRFVERAVTDEIMYRLMQLTGQEYVDVYAATLKKDKSSDKGKTGDTGEDADPAASAVPDADRMPDSQAS